MAREMVQSLHHIHFNSWKALGFTLLELIMTLAIVAILVSAAAPSFSSLIESNKVKRLATEIEWLLVQAKSEAVMRNEELEVHFKRDDGNETAYKNDGEWVIAVTLKAAGVTNRASARNAAIIMLDGKDFTQVYTSVTKDTKGFVIDPIRATSKIQASYRLYADSSQKVKVMINQLTGRVRTCGETGEYYGYKPCD